MMLVARSSASSIYGIDLGSSGDACAALQFDPTLTGTPVPTRQRSHRVGVWQRIGDRLARGSHDEGGAGDSGASFVFRARYG
jgi:hypothetical protein